MKYAVGYQLPDEFDSIVELARDYRESLEEVYFAWPGQASGRSPLGLFNESDMDNILEVFEEELSELNKMNIKLVLLFNSNCYGDNSLSVDLKHKVLKLLQYITHKYKLSAVTTTSPFIANSGCLNFSSNQTFHDNLVAHESGIVKMENVKTKYPSPCWEYMEEATNWAAYLQNSWIRPEDIHNYEQWFQVAKLATRMHSNPRRVLSAYARQKHRGNMMDLTEPSFSSLLILRRTKTPAKPYE